MRVKSWIGTVRIHFKVKIQELPRLQMKAWRPGGLQKVKRGIWICIEGIRICILE
jgi:hypothetical protein